MRKEIVKELIQSDLTASNIEINLNRLFLEKEKVKVNYKKLMGKIGEKGQSKKVAKFILETI